MPDSSTSFTSSLLERAREGDREAFSTLAEWFRPALTRAALYRTRCPCTAEDAVQEALLKAWRAISRFRGESSVSTWLTRIVLNEVKQQQRRSDFKRLQYVESLQEVEANTRRSVHADWRREHAEATESEDTVMRLRRAIACLPSNQRQVLVLSMQEDVKVPDIARELGISEPAVKSRRLRARQELKRRLAMQSHARPWLAPPLA